MNLPDAVCINHEEKHNKSVWKGTGRTLYSPWQTGVQKAALPCGRPWTEEYAIEEKRIARTKKR
jgi:hypothetical protein